MIEILRADWSDLQDRINVLEQKILEWARPILERAGKHCDDLYLLEFVDDVAIIENRPFCLCDNGTCWHELYAINIKTKGLV